jgi:hypothetical protein
MKTYILSLTIFLLSASFAPADNLFIEAGAGHCKSLNSQVFALRYDKDTSRIFGKASYYEFFFSHWNSENRNDSLGVARSISFEIGEDQYFSPTFGIAGVARETRDMGTHFQFYFRIPYDFTIHGRQFSLALIHLSNGKFVFGWDGPNSGENFVTLSIGLF